MKYLKWSLMLLIIFVSCKNGSQNKNIKKQTPPVPVDIIIAENQNFSSNIEVNGTVLSEEMIELHPEVSGRLVYLNIPDGAYVKKGTLLAKINDADLQAQLEQQKVQLELAKKTEQRLKQLLSINSVDQATYDAALSQVNLYTANINVINAQIDKTEIKASFNGSLGLRLVSVGAYVNPTTLIGTLQQTDKVKIDFAVPEIYKNKINIGQKVSVISSFSKDTLLATISAIDPQVNTNTRNIKVRAKLENTKLNSGAFVKVILNNSIKGIVVPTNVIIPDAFSNQVIIIKNGKVVFKNIETGNRTANYVEITNGLNVGDSVIVSGVLFVRPNSKINVKSVKKIEKLINPDI